MVQDRLPLFACLRVATLVVAVGVCAPDLSAQEVEFSEAADSAFAELSEEAALEDCDVCSPEASDFDQWESIVDDPSSETFRTHEDRLAFDWFRHVGFRHSSTHGRNVGRGIPLKGTSWLNRPYHFDWFVGPLLGDDLIASRVSQTNVAFGGIRLGWDFDYYWGTEWRLGWANPTADFEMPIVEPNDLHYLVSDVSFIYYPWGDSKVRPYGLVGFGLTQLDFQDDLVMNHNTTLATMPFGGGIRFRQNPWLAWRLEVLDNLAFGDDRLSTMHNVSITGSMEMRFGARPATYWPWRTARKVW